MRSISDQYVADARQGPSGIRRRELTAFLILAFTIPWLLWLVRALTGIDLVAAGGMLGVGVATFVTVRWVRRPGDIPRDTAMAPLRPTGRLVRFCLIGLAAPPAFAFLAVAIGALAGVYPIDLTGFSGLRAVYAPETAGQDGVPVGTILSALAVNLGMSVLALPLFFCEEWAWRGFLLPRLRPLGLWPALLLGGLIWGLWHLPGFVGTGTAHRLVPFLVTVVLFNVLLGWLRLASGLIWPCVIAHAANNTLVNAFVQVLFAADDRQALSNPWTLGLGGWPGWLVMLAVIAALVAGDAFRRAAAREPVPARMRARPRRLRRMVTGVFTVVLVAALTGAAVQHSLAPTDPRRYAIPGRLVDLGSHHLHLRCLGTQGPTVVFASGWGDSSTTWADLQAALATSGRRSCAYDRAGYAWSSPGTGDQDVTAQADDLAALLSRAGESGPFVFVGHSWGGHVARLFHARWPERVAGMVLLDPADEHTMKDLATPAAIQAGVWSAAAAVGLLRTGDWMVDPREPRLTRDNVPVVFGPATWEAAAAEMRTYDASTRAVREQPRTAGSWGSLPVIVLSARGDQPTITHHSQIAALSTRGRHIVASTDDHYLHLADPALVLHHIRGIARQKACHQTGGEPAAALLRRAQEEGGVRPTTTATC
ncbi:alpha/beta fold hydrolase [Nonomuraea rubra]|uniref:Pimeloyl-ACP methyl ester carboxylesterase n=1 Tax=Nonomuraea rubra TaxID=46180 RepID=A0A7X0NW40_9ACTN|nr:alpha/beta fold hydrolase [Nonomuraea rubra]MBB6550519.1 pimeloyl-ACP methyl ester carboxylesterase [Nonomuraea rubra]